MPRPYQHSEFRALPGGLSLATAVDKVPAGKWRRLTNLEAHPQTGALTTRRGTIQLGAGTYGSGADSVHSISSFTDPVANAGILVVGLGTNLYFGFASPLTLIDTGYSGMPLGMVPYRATLSSLTYLLISDSNKMSKAVFNGATEVVYQLGISPPGAVPPFTPNGAPAVSVANGGGNLDSSAGVGYDWRYTYYDANTGGESNPSAIQAALTTAVNQSVDVTPGAASTDPQVTNIRWWRRGGTLGDTWRLVGTVANAVAPFNDNSSDASIASAQVLSLTNDVPVTTVNGAGVPVYQQPLAYIWGPYGGNVIFGNGDKYRPGFTYWCNPGNPDGWSSVNNVEVTQPSDALQNGFFWNGRTFSFSLSKLYEGFPASIGTNQYVFYDTGAGKGIASPWSFVASADHPFAWWLTNDQGIVEWPGAGEAFSITNEELWPTFNLINEEDVPPLSLPGTPGALYRMEYFQDELRFAYLGADNTYHVLMCQVFKAGKPWRHAVYPWNPTVIYSQIESPYNLLLYGTSNGKIYQEGGFGGSGSFGAGDIVNGVVAPVPVRLRGGYYGNQDPELKNQYSDVVLDIDPQNAAIVPTALYDDGNAPTITLTTQQFTGRQRVALSLQNLQGQDVYANDFAMDLSWVTSGISGPTAIYGYEVVWRPDVLPVPHMHIPGTFWSLPGWSYPFDGYITLRSSGPVNISLKFDNGATLLQTVTTGTSLVKTATYVQFGPQKGKLVSVDLNSTTADPFWFYDDESYLNMQGWGVSQPIKIHLGAA